MPVVLFSEGRKKERKLLLDTSTDMGDMQWKKKNEAPGVKFNDDCLPKVSTLRVLLFFLFFLTFRLRQTMIALRSRLISRTSPDALSNTRYFTRARGASE